MKALVHDLTGQYIAFFNDDVDGEQVRQWVQDMCVSTENYVVRNLLTYGHNQSVVEYRQMENSGYHMIYIDQQGAYTINMQIVDIVPVL